MIQRRSFISSLVAMLGAAFTGWRQKPVVGQFIARPVYASKPVLPGAGIAMIRVTNGGSGYSSIPTIAISDAGGMGAAATRITE